MVKEFHEKYNQPVAVKMDDPKLIELRLKLIDEEITEMFDEVVDRFGNSFNPKQIDKVKLTKEMADVIYVVCGMAVTFGLPLDEVFEEVHKSNMTKTGDKREDGKVLKGPDYRPPQLEQYFKTDSR